MTDEYSVGDTVVDSEVENPDEAVVVRKTDMRIGQWTIDNEGTTVHDENEGYNENELTTLVVFKEYLDDEWPEWREIDPEELYKEVMEKEHVAWYAFPMSRLKPVNQDEEVE